MRLPFDLLLITPDQPAHEVLALARAALPAVRGERVALQLRSKQLAAEEREGLGRALRELTHELGICLFVNGDLALARALAADGVQLPEAGPRVAEARAVLGPNACIGASRHDLAGVREAGAAGASFVLVSPVFAVPGKAPALGLSGLADLCAQSALPVVALGGVTVAVSQQVIAAGAAGIAVIREVFAQLEPGMAARRLLQTCAAPAR